MLVLGGGRVGAAAALALRDRGLDVVVVDKQNVAPQMPGIRVQVGDAADPATLERAGIKNAPSIIITTHDDDINIYLTIYCRRLRPDVQIISRVRQSDSVYYITDVESYEIWQNTDPEHSRLKQRSTYMLVLEADGSWKVYDFVGEQEIFDQFEY